MTEIEKRARERYDVSLEKGVVTYNQNLAQAYIIGATEQDPIAYLRGRNDALKEMAEVIEQKEREEKNVKKRMLTWLSHNITKYYGTKNSWLHIEKMLADLEKHMEE